MIETKSQLENCVAVYLSSLGHVNQHSQLVLHSQTLVKDIFEVLQQKIFVSYIEPQKQDITKNAETDWQQINSLYKYLQDQLEDKERQLGYLMQQYSIQQVSLQTSMQALQQLSESDEFDVAITKSIEQLVDKELRLKNESKRNTTLMSELTCSICDQLKAAILKFQQLKHGAPIEEQKKQVKQPELAKPAERFFAAMQ